MTTSRYTFQVGFAAFAVALSVTASTSAQTARAKAETPPAPTEVPSWLRHVRDEAEDGEVCMPRVIDDWDEDEELPPGYRPRERLRTGFLHGGVATLSAVYGVTAAATIAPLAQAKNADDRLAVAPLFIPVAGPFIAMGTLRTSDVPPVAVVLGLSGAAQCVGLSFLIVGLAAPRTVLVRSYDEEEETSWFLSPVVSPENGGLLLRGAFW